MTASAVVRSPTHSCDVAVSGSTCSVLTGEAAVGYASSLTGYHLITVLFQLHIVACLQNARNVKQAENRYNGTALQTHSSLGSGSVAIT
jgi:hypothetical protein